MRQKCVQCISLAATSEAVGFKWMVDSIGETKVRLLDSAIVESILSPGAACHRFQLSWLLYSALVLVFYVTKVGHAHAHRKLPQTSRRFVLLSLNVKIFKLFCSSRSIDGSVCPAQLQAMLFALKSLRLFEFRLTI
jgi:hypothetical protein